ncbi:MAG: hypothetical protein HYV67_02195 [Candidatus Taylorbacteria bacterium]|nr:hypothetical protein [Candidatus Taylorbacteria bacterium]
MKVLVIIRSLKQSYRFTLKVHKAKRPEDQQLEAEFYEKWSLEHRVPEGTHCEFEIIEPFLEHHVHRTHLHIHQSTKNGKWFVCWTQIVPEEKSAEALLKFWCAGTVYTMETGKGFHELMPAEKIVAQCFGEGLEILEKDHQISVAEFCFQSS